MHGEFVSFPLTVVMQLLAPWNLVEPVLEGCYRSLLRRNLRAHLYTFRHTFSHIFWYFQTQPDFLVFFFLCTLLVLILIFFCLCFWFLGWGVFCLWFSAGNLGNFLFIIDVLKFHRNFQPYVKIVYFLFCQILIYFFFIFSFQCVSAPGTHISGLSQQFGRFTSTV